MFPAKRLLNIAIRLSPNFAAAHDYLKLVDMDLGTYISSDTKMFIAGMVLTLVCVAAMQFSGSAISMLFPSTGRGPPTKQKRKQR
jgi:hypothetical protein